MPYILFWSVYNLSLFLKTIPLGFYPIKKYIVLNSSKTQTRPAALSSTQTLFSALRRKAQVDKSKNKKNYSTILKVFKKMHFVEEIIHACWYLWGTYNRFLYKFQFALWMKLFPKVYEKIVFFFVEKNWFLLLCISFQNSLVVFFSINDWLISFEKALPFCGMGLDGLPSESLAITIKLNQPSFHSGT